MMVSTRSNCNDGRLTPIEVFQGQRATLIAAFLDGKEPAFMERHARMLDEYFFESYARSGVGPKINMANNAYAVVALGGYGRAEQCYFSDIDLLFLFESDVPPEAGELVREMIYPLWDSGFEVAHVTLAVEECVKMAAENFETVLALLDARFICGMSPLHSRMMQILKKEVVSPKGNDIVDWLIEQNRQRHLHFGDSSYLLEPNLKEGQGGLRDYHTMLWLARMKSGLKTPRDLEFDGYISHDEFKTLMGAVNFIWLVRNHLHHLTGRKSDQLHFEYQKNLAAELNFEGKKGQSAVEMFLGTLHGQMEYVKQRHLMFLHELGLGRKKKRKTRRALESGVKGLKVKEEMLYFTSARAILKTPEVLMKIFEESSRLKIPLSAEAKRLVKEFLYLVDQRFRVSLSVISAFEKILLQWVPTFNVLDEMMHAGFLPKFIPQMQTVVDRIQYDEYHLYPVDKHLLRTVQAVKSFGVPSENRAGPLCAELYKGLRNKRPLIWAALLHDVGKGEPAGDHSQSGSQIVQEILAEKGMSEKDIETAVFLVRHHLLLAKIATRRDVDDEETAIFCARQIQNTGRLKMLYLLTVADSIATGPKAWNDWTATLFRDLFLRVLNTLEKGELASQKAVEHIENKKEQIVRTVSSPDEKKEMDGLIHIMSPRYLLYTPAHDIVEHIKLYQDLGASEFIWRVNRLKELKSREVVVCAKDRPGLFSKIAGVFTLNGLDILDVKVYTWRNNIALDVFNVTSPLDLIFEDEKWLRVEKDLERVLSGKLDLNAALAQKKTGVVPAGPQIFDRASRVVVDNQSSSYFTIVEVFTYDFPGLLFLVTDALFRCRLDIWVAKIATKVDQVVDVFYVRDFDGQKVDMPAQVSAIQAAVENVLPDAK